MTRRFRQACIETVSLPSSSLWRISTWPETPSPFLWTTSSGISSNNRMIMMMTTMVIIMIIISKNKTRLINAVLHCTCPAAIFPMAMVANGHGHRDFIQATTTVLLAHMMITVTRIIIPIVIIRPSLVHMARLPIVHHVFTLHWLHWLRRIVVLFIRLSLRFGDSFKFTSIAPIWISPSSALRHLFLSHLLTSHGPPSL